MRFLLPTQQNEILKLIETGEMDPREFEWGWQPRAEDGENIGDRLVHSPTGLYFAFIEAARLTYHTSIRTEGHYTVEFSPDEHHVRGKRDRIQWGEVLRVFLDTWLAALRREYEAPDLWKQLSESRLPTLKPDLDEQSTFTPEEVERVEKCVDQLTTEVRKEREKLGLSEEEVKWIAGEFNALKLAARHSDKRGFRNTLIGTFVSVYVTVSLAPDQTQQFFEMVAGWFDWLVVWTQYLPKE